MRLPKLAKKNIIIISVIVIVIILILIIIFGDNQKGGYPDYTTYSTKDNGTKAVYLLAKQMGYDVSRFERPSRFLPQHALLVAIKPGITVFNAKIEQKYLWKWIQNGNTILIADSIDRIDQYDIIKAADNKAKRINNYTYYSFGKGNIIFCDPKAITNKTLRGIKTGIEFISMLDNEGKATVLFNEYYHGFGAQSVTITDLLGQSGELVLLQLVLGILLLLLVSARRFGKPEVVFQIIKRMENENLFALSNLYIKSKSNVLVLQIHFERLKRDLSRFLGSETILDDDEIVSISQGYKFLVDSNIEDIIKTSRNQIDSGKIGTKKLHVIIQKLEGIRKGII